MRLERPVLQVALDFENLSRALPAAKEAVEGGADWIEAGTPLIKSEGLDAVRELKKAFPDRSIVADMKVMDTGAFEVEIAAKAGADLVTILGAADDDTIADGVRGGELYGAEVVVDLLGVPDPVARARRVAELGAAAVCWHVGIDMQMQAKTPFAVLAELVKGSPIPVAVAGGLNSETVAEAVRAGAQILIVGGAITKSPQMVEATRRIRTAIDTGAAQATELFRRYGGTEIREAFLKVSSPNVSDAMQRQGAMHGILPHLRDANVRMAGPAVTVVTRDGDWAKPVEAIDRAGPGDVIVVDAGGGTTAIWGELASWSAHGRQVAGVVIDGAARDVDAILDLGFPLFSRNVSPNAGEPKGLGEIGIEVVVGGQRVRPGDWIVGDLSGVVVVPRERAQEIANRALDVLEHENRVREEIQRGSTLGSVQKLERWERVG
ncbi:MAG TPA: 3-hexulose-6-phosphate synthase [Thermoplasmata archaeon]|jgi:3-hexulose-6-phosphate synthase / 6-phospho-3-hexuloisomerase|nr:3-hexulose-6-phosphate synthase [Thermoplasmata archaeon]